MKETNDAAFFALCEYSLADSQTAARCHRSLMEKIIYFVVRHLGVVGFLFAYGALVLRESALLLTCYRQTAVLDIHGKLILRHDEIQAECQPLILRRRHFPSRRIFREIRSALRRHINLRKSAELNASVATRAASNEIYLIWLLHFYVHRSIILANADTIRSSILGVVSLEEFTPLIAGYLSAFADLDLPLALYLPVKLADPKLTLQAVPLFKKVIVKNGGVADFLRANGKEDVLLEEAAPSGGRNAKRRERTSAAVFLASFYTRTDADLVHFLSHSTIPYLQQFRKLWDPIDIRIFCHPNDDRARATLEQAGFEVIGAAHQATGRMGDADVVLSGNSSVVDEAITADIPVIYCGKLDCYSYDLMGYVDEGLVLDGTRDCPTRAAVEEFFKRPQTRARLERYRQGSGSHRSVSLSDAIQTGVSPHSSERREAMQFCDQPDSPICR